MAGSGGNRAEDRRRSTTRRATHTLITEGSNRRNTECSREVRAARYTRARTGTGESALLIATRGFKSWIRSEERQVGNECVRTCSYRWSPTLETITHNSLTGRQD